jgi:transposase
MSGFIDGQHRQQAVLFPNTLDEYVTEENPVRFIDAFVDSLDLSAMGFTHARPLDQGRPPYDPADLLKLYLYGYLNKVRSTRRLERECQRNLEVMWLMGKLAPDFKTIADFRRDNADHLRPVFRELVALCKGLDLLDPQLVAIDGSKFKAMNSFKRSVTPASLRESLATLDEKIARYLRELDENDRKEAQEESLPAHVPNLKKKIAELKERKQQHEALLHRMESSGETEMSLTDPDCRVMRTHGSYDLCYNTQIAVEARNKIIVEYDVSNHASDDGELAQMAVRAREALGVERLNVTADKGYYSGAQVQRCVENGITPYVPEMKVRSGAAKRHGLSPAFALDKFRYDGTSDTVVCPTGQRLTPVGPGIEVRWGMRSATRRAQVYRTDACFRCPHYMGDCTTNPKGRHVMRTEYDTAMEAMRERMKTPEGRRILSLRQALAEHPFGTIKRGFQQGHLLLKGLRKTTGEMGLSLIAYDLRRMINILGTTQLVSAVHG